MLFISCQEEDLQSKTKNPRGCKLTNQHNGCVTHISVVIFLHRCKLHDVHVMQFNNLPTDGFYANTFDHRPQKEALQLEHAHDVKRLPPQVNRDSLQFTKFEEIPRKCALLGTNCNKPSWQQ